MDTINITYHNYLITTNKSLMSVADIHKWISEKSYWAKNIPFHTMKNAIENSFCIGVIFEGRLVGFGRLVTDYSTFGYLADVYVEEEYRGVGLGLKMMEILFDLDWVKGLRRVMLATRDAHELYKKVDFTELKNPDRIMEIVRPHIYEVNKAE